MREAVRLHSSSIDSGMILLGVLRSAGSSGETAFRLALAAAGSDVETLRAAVERPDAQAS